jgi:hypothetical protein
MTGIGLPLEAREPDPTSRGTDDDYVVDRCPAEGEAEVREQSHTPRPDQVAAGLVPGEAGLVHQGDAGSASSQDGGGHAACRTGANHEDVEAVALHGSPLLPNRLL